MNNSLVLNKVTLTVNVNGVDYPFVADHEFAMKISSLAKEALKRADICAYTGCDDCVEASKFLSYALDTLIGEGSSYKMFGTDIPDPVEICDVLGLISDVFHSYRRERIYGIKGAHV
jgi:hypothetical protein